MTRSRITTFAVFGLICLGAILFSGCARCGCNTRTSHGQAVIAELQAKRKTLKDERAATARALAAEARVEEGISEKSSYYEYLRSRLERIDWDICSINCEIYPH